MFSKIAIATKFDVIWHLHLGNLEADMRWMPFLYETRLSKDSPEIWGVPINDIFGLDKYTLHEITLH